MIKETQVTNTEEKAQKVRQLERDFVIIVDI
jgi:hypothetical protein